MQGFFDFIRKQGVVGLAIGFILGASVSKVVTAFVTDIVNPVTGVFLGSAQGLKSAYLQIGPAQILYGDFISVLLDFLIIATIVYFIFKGLRFEKMDKKN